MRNELFTSVVLSDRFGKIRSDISVGCLWSLGVNIKRRTAATERQGRPGVRMKV